MASRLRMNDANTGSVSVSVNGTTFRLRQAPSSHNHGLVLWDASIALAQFYEHSGRLTTGYFTGLRVLELGAGTGLLSCVLAAAGAEVMCTDLPGVVDLARQNVHDNAAASWGPVTCVAYTWGDDVTPLVETGVGGGFDLIVGTDVAYSEVLNPVLLASAAAIARASEQAHKAAAAAEGGGERRGGGPLPKRRRCAVHFANEARCATAQAVFDTHAAAMFDVKRVPTRHLHPAWRPFKGGVPPSGDDSALDETRSDEGEEGELDGGPQMLVFEMKLKAGGARTVTAGR